MPKSTKTPAKPAKRAAAKSAARNTDSGPSQVTAALFDDTSRKAAQTQELAAAMPHNPTKPAEHGFANGTRPPQGASAKPASRLPTGSTLSEDNGSDKTGGVAPEGVNATIDSLGHRA